MSEATRDTESAAFGKIRDKLFRIPVRLRTDDDYVVQIKLTTLDLRSLIQCQRRND